MDTANDQLSIKNLLFSKAIPNYVIPVPTAGQKVYPCIDCGDKYLLNSSYEYHVNRKSVKITYFCRFCNISRIFYNRCNMLNHIRSHAFKTATINVSDLQLEPLPLKFFNMNLINVRKNEKEQIKIPCVECKFQIKVTATDTIQNARSRHYMEFDKVQTCPVCLYALPSICALKAHLRFHLKFAPYICPECGVQYKNKAPAYPYNNHNCEGFKMLRSTARVKCSVSECHLVNPSEFKEHIKLKHLKTVYKCSLCYVACFDAQIMSRHFATHEQSGDNKIFKFYQCQLCPGKLVAFNQIENHLKSKNHYIDNNFAYPCWTCGKIYDDVASVIEHVLSDHNTANDAVAIECAVRYIQGPSKAPSKTDKKTKLFKVIKKCEKCKRSFTYKCKFEQIKTLPMECPYKCTLTSAAGETALHHQPTENEMLTCNLCQNRISQDWDEIKKHFNEYHKKYRCIDLQVILPKLDLEKYISNQQRKNLKLGIRKRVSRRNRIKPNQSKTAAECNEIEASTTTVPGIIDKPFVCNKCDIACENKELWEIHLLTHRDPCMAYQCMECGQCFVVKPSFAKHLLLEHSMEDVEDYISEKKCFNEQAFVKYQDNTPSEPLRENQCNICRDQFDNSDDLEKHFRVHGMAFLMKNNSNKNPSP